MSTLFDRPLSLELPPLELYRDVCNDSTPTTSLETERTSISEASTPLSSLTSGLDSDSESKDEELVRRIGYHVINPYLEISSSASARATHFLGPSVPIPPTDTVRLRIHAQDKKTRLIHPADASSTSALYTVILQKSKFGCRPHVQVYHHLGCEANPFYKRLVGEVRIHHRVRDRVDWEVYGERHCVVLEGLNLKGSDCGYPLGLRSTMRTPRKKSLAHLNTKSLVDDRGKSYHDQETLIQVPIMDVPGYEGQILCIPKELVLCQEDLTRLVTVAMALSLRNQIILRRGAKQYKYDPLGALCPELGTVGTGTTGFVLTANLVGGLGA